MSHPCYTSPMTDEILDALLPRLRERGREVLFRRGETILRMGEPVERLMVVLEGRAKLTVRSGEGRELLLFFTRDVEVLGDLEFFSPGNATATVRAVTDCRVLSADLADMRAAAARDGSMLSALGASVAFKLRRANAKHSLNTLYSLKERLAAYLYAQESGASGEDHRGESLRDTAVLLGTSYRHLNRVASELCAEGLISRTRWGLAIADRERLGRLAGDIFFY